MKTNGFTWFIINAFNTYISLQVYLIGFDYIIQIRNEIGIQCQLLTRSLYETNNQLITFHVCIYIHIQINFQIHR